MLYNTRFVKSVQFATSDTPTVCARTGHARLQPKRGRSQYNVRDRSYEAEVPQRSPRVTTPNDSITRRRAGRSTDIHFPTYSALSVTPGSTAAAHRAGM